jgi:hypothetical protein
MAGRGYRSVIAIIMEISFQEINGGDEISAFPPQSRDIREQTAVKN